MSTHWRVLPAPLPRCAWTRLLQIPRNLTAEAVSQDSVLLYLSSERQDREGPQVMQPVVVDQALRAAESKTLQRMAHWNSIWFSSTLSEDMDPFPKF